MKLGILSDTHIPDIKKEIPTWVTAGLKDCDYIIHAGDITGFKFLQRLKELAPVKAVRGNCDRGELVSQLKPYKELTLANLKLGITHGHLIEGDLITGLSYKFSSADLIIFGHTHNAFHQQIAGQVFLNPGSATVRKRKSFYSFALVEIEAGRIINLEFIKKEG